MNKCDTYSKIVKHIIWDNKSFMVSWKGRKYEFCGMYEERINVYNN